MNKSLYHRNKSPLHKPVRNYVKSYLNHVIHNEELLENFCFPSYSDNTYNWLDCIFHFLFDNDSLFRSNWNNVPYLNCEDIGQSHILAPHNFNTFADSSICKKIITDKPPYVIKLLSDWNHTITDISTHQCQASNGFFAIQMSKRKFIYKHTMTSAT